MLKIDNKELEKYYADGKTMIWQYNTLYEINNKQGVYKLVKIYHKKQNGGITIKGRFMPMKKDYAMSFI